MIAMCSALPIYVNVKFISVLFLIAELFNFILFLWCFDK